MTQAAHDLRLIVILRSRRPCEGERERSKADQHESLLFDRVPFKTPFGPILRVRDPGTGRGVAQATRAGSRAGAAVSSRTTLAAVQQSSREAAAREPSRDGFC